MDDSIFSRLCNIPLVSSAVCHVERIYTENKQRNRLTHVAFSAAELGLRTVLSVTQPLINHLQKPMSRLSEQINHLQTSYPFIQTPTCEILSAAKVTLNEILNLADVDKAFQQFEEESDQSPSLVIVESSPGVSEAQSTRCFRGLSDHFDWVLAMTNATLTYMHRSLFLETGRVSQGAQSLSVVSALHKVQQMVLCCSSCTPGWSFSNELSGDALCITCGINKHLLKVLKENVQLSVGNQKDYLTGILLQIIYWLINHSPLKLLTPEFHIGCRFEDDGESFGDDVDGNDVNGNGGNGVYGYVPIHPLDLANIILQANHVRSYWKRMHS